MQSLNIKNQNGNSKFKTLPTPIFIILNFALSFFTLIF